MPASLGKKYKNLLCTVSVLFATFDSLALVAIKLLILIGREDKDKQDTERQIHISLIIISNVIF